MATKNWDAFKEYISSLDTIDYREYQVTISKEASQRNTLVILPTAMGKTVIAVQVALNRLARYPWGKVVVLAPTRPLVNQHVRSFGKFLDVTGNGKQFFSCQELNGKISREKRTEMFKRANLVFATPQTLQNDLASHFYDLSGCVLLVLDECHKTGERYAYNEIATRYLQHCPDPIILGLTASPGRKQEHVLDLCQRLHMERVTIRTPDDPDVAPYMYPIEMEVRDCNLPLEYDEVELSLRELLHDRLEQIRARGFLKQKPVDQINKMDLIQLGRVLWSIIARETAPGDVLDAAGDVPSAQPPFPSQDRTGFFFWLISVQAQAMKIMHVIELITTQGIPTAFEFIRKMRERVEETRSKASSNYRLLQETAFKKVEIFLKKGVEGGETHPKTRLLLEMLEEMVDPATGELAGSVIVFTQFRDTASFLLAAIEGLNGGKQGDSRPFRPVRFVGQATKSPRDTGLKQQDQEKMLDEFRAGKHNILVATRIAEEGLDIPSVRSIIFYEPVPSEIRYIQRRGRTGRHEKGFVTILIARGTLDEVFYKVALCRLDHMERIADGLKDRPLQDIIRVPIGEPAPSDIAINDVLAAYEKQLASTPAPAGRELDLDAGVITSALEEANRQVDEFNAWRYVDLAGVQDPAVQACMEIATRKPASASEWHDMLRRLTGKEKVEVTPMKRTRSIKRERKVPSSESGVKIFNKVTKWVYDQVKAIGTANAKTGRIEMAFAELKEMAKMEEILPEDFEYGVKNGIKNKFWELAKGADGTFKISIKADF
nr:helicase-related protein [Candidatus Sigynarchaeum springense]